MLSKSFLSSKKCPKIPPKYPQEPSKTPKDASETLLRRTKRLPRRYKTPQEAPKSLARGPKKAPKKKLNNSVSPSIFASWPLSLQASKPPSLQLPRRVPRSANNFRYDTTIIDRVDVAIMYDTIADRRHDHCGNYARSLIVGTATDYRYDH